MQMNVFPQIYNNIKDREANDKIIEARQKTERRIVSINNTHTSEPIAKGIIMGAMVGVFGGFIACTCVCINTNSDIGLLTWVIVGIISVAMGVIVDKSAMEDYKINEKNIVSRISKEKRWLEDEIKNINEETRRAKYQYEQAFDAEVQRISVQFAESELAKEVIEWMTEGFSRTIDATDRRGHIEQINVPFMFKVYNNLIKCNLGTYDFEIKRCRNLTGPLEQMALAKAIASAIQLNIKMKYPKDVSGTEVCINIKYLYTEEYPETTIIYVAPNGDYEAAHDW